MPAHCFLIKVLCYIFEFTKATVFLIAIVKEITIENQNCSDADRGCCKIIECQNIKYGYKCVEGS